METATIRNVPTTAVALPIGPTIAEGYRNLVSNVRALLQLLLIPILIGMSLVFMAPLIPSPWIYVVQQLLFALGSTLLGVSWLRLLLLEDRNASRLIPRFTQRHLRFGCYVLLITLLGLPLVAIWYFFPEGTTTPLSELVHWLAYVFVGFVQLRFAFVFPATAVDERYGLVLAWRHSQSVSLPLFAIFLITVVAPSAALDYGLKALYGTGQIPYLWWGLGHIGMWLLHAMCVSIIAVAFRRVTGWIPPLDHGLLERFD